MSLNAHGQRLDAETETLLPTTGGVFDECDVISFQANASGANFSADFNITGTMKSGHSNNLAVAFDLIGLNQISSKTNRSQTDPAVHHTLPAARTPPHLAHPWAVRRLTPVECERLQGFPDNFTRIPYRSKPADKCPDGPRYKALGNSMAVNVMQWIFQRIRKVDAA